MENSNILTASKDQAIESYQQGSISDRALLIGLFGDKFFKPITERINSFEDACLDLGKDPVKVRPFSNPANSEQEALNAIAEIWVVVEAANEGKQPDWKNANQYKYEPVFDMSGPELVFNVVYRWSGPRALAPAFAS